MGKSRYPGDTLVGTGRVTDKARHASGLLIVAMVMEGPNGELHAITNKGNHWSASKLAASTDDGSQGSWFDI
jgi:hypothetical protein